MVTYGTLRINQVLELAIMATCRERRSDFNQIKLKRKHERGKINNSE